MLNLMEDEHLTFLDLTYKHNFLDESYGGYNIFHYTNAKGLMGIIRCEDEEYGKIHFWFSESDSLNDISEGKHIKEQFKNTCDNMLRNSEISDEFYNIIFNVEISKERYFSFPIPSEKPNEHLSVLDYGECRAFICSFSLKEDSLDMWRYYSKSNSGYGLNFDSYLFDDLISYNVNGYRNDVDFSLIRSFKVIYDDNEKQRLLRNVILDTYEAFRYFNGAKEERNRQTTNHIIYVLKNFQFQFKHNCYASEEEYRFVFYLPNNKPRLLKNKLPEVKYREQDGIIVPYLDIEICNKETSLISVMISPFNKNVAVIDNTKKYLANCGFNCNVFSSSLPTR